MPLILPTTKDTLRVAVSIDSALDMTAEEHDYYLESLDEGLLKFHEGQQPTWFVMKKVLPFGLSKRVQNEQISTKGREIQLNYGYILEEVRCALVDIQNPPSVSDEQKINFKKASDGGADEELVSLLHAAGVVQELYKARAGAIKNLSELAKKK